ncbi:ATPase [Capsaspora owczarzaki ATCC 30864]|uniref:Phospholipid-transporting ATPase n=1 Tax=Capsaspora owczarzaki (strain ATCC 30864) TaxID=595528 RepID=A0A0D2VGL0_CAPO3|nr:ATPase [Capsaspora owczarzaki ATCC 30864]KJE89012.1 ATPase [Capsaspora owczarzaki ATCC 30864]|eukprot:XP_004365443.2 ATPase [Capsaspora owczarzaki ATCC 30864]
MSITASDSRALLPPMADGSHLNEDGSEKERRVAANNPGYNAAFKSYVGNHIVTSKYTILTFIPVNLFEQFRRVANAYFLFLLILQLIPAISALSWVTTAIPLIFVLAVTAVKDGFDDFKRHKSDHGVNTRPSRVLRNNAWIDVQWHEVVVGDIIAMNDGEFVAADLFLLSTSEPHGICYVETAELDGETNLKIRQAIPDTNHLDETHHLNEFDGVVFCEPPNNNLHRFDGALTYKNKQFPIDNDKILLRGCVVRNTKWIHGLVLFAGHDTKLMQNSGGARFKRTHMDKLMNNMVITIFCFLATLCLIAAIGSGIWTTLYGGDFRIYLPWETFTSTPGVIGVLNFFSFIILLNTLVPISLYVSVEIIRLIQSWLIDWDRGMYFPENNTPAAARSTTLTEELGQIQYIFSDKTGTLTRNVMSFLKCTIDGVSYGKALTAANAGAAARSDGNASAAGALTRVDFSWNALADQDFEFFDESLVKECRGGNPRAADFFRLLAICHTVVPEETEAGGLEYKAQSPDEAALVSAAKNFGFVFMRRTPTQVVISIHGQEETYDLLTIIEFNSDRKRMSIVVRMPNGKLRLYCKGADSVIYARLGPNSCEDLKTTTSQHLEVFANDGLRTLCLAYRDLGEEEFTAWQKEHHEASIALTDREARIGAVAERIETDLTLIGATAIEDKLQEGVPEAIANLARADIKIWVLTGDKQETAINIGFSCQLLRTDMELCIVNGKEEKDTLASLEQAKRVAEVNPDVAKALVIDGHSLHHALEPHNKLKFLEVASKSRAVICCRVSPLQKALVVTLVKEHKKAVTLAIGDGANDVSMIQAAHIGVGISGMEGRQAVLAADFSFAQFRFLERLLLVHGRWSYMRMCKFMAYFFYKNFAFTLCQFWYAFFSAFSATTLYDAWMITFYNVIFTSLPVLMVGIFDQDVDDKTSLKFPQLYIPGQRNLLFNKTKFWLSLAKGIWTSVVLFFFALGIFYDQLSPSGRTNNDLVFLGTCVAAVLVLVVNLEIGLNTYSWTIVNAVFVIASILSIWAFYFILYSVPAFGETVIAYYWAVYRIIASGAFWFYLGLGVATIFLPLLSMRYYQITYRPTPVDIVREIRKLDSTRDRQNRDSKSSDSLELGVREPTKPSPQPAHHGFAFSQEPGGADLITPGPRCSIGEGTGMGIKKPAARE